VVLDGEAGHGYAVFEAGGRALGFERLKAYGGEEDSIEAEGLPRGFGDGKVAEVRGIEAASEEGYAHVLMIVDSGRPAATGAKVLSGGLAELELAGFVAIAADAHVAPAAGVVLALVEEEPAAGTAGAFAEVGELAGEEEFGGGFGEKPERGFDAAAEAFPTPCELGLFEGETALRGGLLEESFEGGEIGIGDVAAGDEGVGGTGEGLAEMAGFKEDAGANGGGEIGALELAKTGVGEQAGLVGEAEEIAVGVDEFNRTVRDEAIVEGVDEVEDRVTGEEFK
jgi:hypothetical protein